MVHFHIGRSIPDNYSSDEGGIFDIRRRTTFVSIVCPYPHSNTPVGLIVCPLKQHILDVCSVKGSVLILAYVEYLRPCQKTVKPREDYNESTASQSSEAQRGHPALMNPQLMIAS